MNEKQIQELAISEHIAWIDKVLDEDKRINMDKIKNESQMHKMWKRTGNTPQISFVRGE